MTSNPAFSCNYCGVGHASYQSHCTGCGGAMPAGEIVPAAVSPRWRRRDRVAAAIGAAALLTAALIAANWLSGPQQVEIVGMPLPHATGEPPAAALTFEPGSIEHRHLMNAHFASAYAAISPLRMLLLEFRMMEGNYPLDFEQVGIDAKELVDGRTVTGVELLDGGVLRAQLDAATFGDNAVLVLTPVDVMAGMQVRWQCTTSVPDNMRIAVAGNMECPYDARATE